jgi:hypothetical protein
MLNVKKYAHTYIAYVHEGDSIALRETNIKMAEHVTQELTIEKYVNLIYACLKC